MNKDIMEGKWEQAKGHIQRKWGDLTNDELDQVQGNSQILAGKLQEKYGYSKEKAEEEIDAFYRDNPELYR